MTIIEREQMREFESVQPVVEFEEILHAVKIEPDEDCSEPPWEHSDGWEHRLVAIRHEQEENASGFLWHNRRKHRVVLTDPENWLNFEYFRGKGASKQVARELTAQIQKEAREKIARWYESGWQVWYISCEIHGVTDSCGGYYADDWSKEDVQFLNDEKMSMARNVASELEEKGFFVADKYNQRTPEKKKTRESKINIFNAR